jgi:hypothetical protein
MTAGEPELESATTSPRSTSVYGDVALVRCTGVWRSRDGQPGMSRYVDVYVRGAAGWRVVSAQITRPGLYCADEREGAGSTDS